MALTCCGLDCEKCEVYIATQTNDNTIRAKVAKQLSELHKVSINPELINCNGCTSQGVKATFCAYMCEIGKCCQNQHKDVLDCAKCIPFSCSYLNWNIARGISGEKLSDKTGLEPPDLMPGCKMDGLPE